MSKMEDMQSYFDEYPEALRKARASSSLTLAELARISGVPYNSICSVNAGTTKQPLLFYSAATCKALGLSLDELMGLRVPEVLAVVVIAAIALMAYAAKMIIKNVKSPRD